MKGAPTELGSQVGAPVAGAQGGAGSMSAAQSPELGAAAITPTGGAGGRPGAPGAVDPVPGGAALGRFQRWRGVCAPRWQPNAGADAREPVPVKRRSQGRVGSLLVTLDEEELRQSLIQEARKRVDAATERHDRACRELDELERRRGNARAIELARNAAAAARLELTEARRQLIRSIS